MRVSQKCIEKRDPSFLITKGFLAREVVFSTNMWRCSCVVTMIQVIKLCVNKFLWELHHYYSPNYSIFHFFYSFSISQDVIYIRANIFLSFCRLLTNRSGMIVTQHNVNISTRHPWIIWLKQWPIRAQFSQSRNLVAHGCIACLFRPE